MPYKDPDKMREARRACYHKNKKYYRQKRRERKREIGEWLNELKIGLKCSQCGEDHPACIQFHHRDPSAKDFMISKAVIDGYSKKRILEEVDKCTILCANCHFKLHHEAKVSGVVGTSWIPNP